MRTLVVRAVAASIIVLGIVPLHSTFADGGSNEFADDLDVEEEDLSAEQLRGLHKMIDHDGDGRVSLQDVLSFAHATGRKIALKDVGSILEELDLNKDGKLQLEEHMVDLETQADGGTEDEMKELMVRKELERVKFVAADDNQDGVLDGSELASLFYPETHEAVLEVTVAETFKLKDRNGDGKLSVLEFWEAEVENDDLTEEEKQDFARLDLDKSEFLDHVELRAWESGRFHTLEAMQKVFELADKDNDMHLTADELVNHRAELAITDGQYHFIEWAEHHEL